MVNEAPIINHSEAKELAKLKPESNLARCYLALAAELASLRAELHASDHDKHDYRYRLYAAEKRLAEAKEAIKKFQFPPVDWDARLAKRDADRYRYLRTNPAMLLHVSNRDFDAAIDAALAAQEKGEQ